MGLAGLTGLTGHEEGVLLVPLVLSVPANTSLWNLLDPTRREAPIYRD